jgi:hypothetical protein
LWGMAQGVVNVPGGGALQEARRDWFELFRQFRWVWIIISGLLLVILITVSMNLIFPPPKPEPIGQELAERWQELDPLPEPLRRMAVAAYDGDIFTLGGESQEGVSGAVYVYDFELGSWQRKAEKPTPVSEVQGVTIGEKIYVPGGKLSDGSQTDVLEIYNPRSDSWEKGASLPIALSAYALADFEGQVYLFGGLDGKKAMSNVFVYDPDIDTWADGQPMGDPRAFARAVSQEDRIILIGGLNESHALSDVLVYFPTRDSVEDEPWLDFESLPEPRYAFGAAGVADNVYIMGGKPKQEFRKDSGGFLLNGEEWIEVPTEPDYNGHESDMVSLGSLLSILDSDDLGSITTFWTYKAFYFNIYIPIVP